MTTFVLCWAFVAVIVGFSGILRNTALPMPALCAVMTLGLLGFLATSRARRDRALAVGIRSLIAIHLLRFIGVYFLWLSRQGLIAADYGLLAGWGPLIVAVGAVVLLLVFRPEDATGRQAILLWNIIGSLDVLLVFAVMSRMARPDPLVQGGFTSLPLSLLPTFIVPLVIVSHVLIFVWWFRGRGGRRRS
jgi:hypothetical protein